MLEELIIDLIKDLIASAHTEGFAVFFFNATIILTIQVRSDKEVREGLKGDNKLFEAPEISLYFFFWYSPYILMYGAYMQVMIDPNILLFMAANLAFAFLGRQGLQWILATRFGGSSSSTETMKETTKTTTKDETGN